MLQSFIGMALAAIPSLVTASNLKPRTRSKRTFASLSFPGRVGMPAQAYASTVDRGGSWLQLPPAKAKASDVGALGASPRSRTGALRESRNGWWGRGSSCGQAQTATALRCGGGSPAPAGAVSRPWRRSRGVGRCSPGRVQRPGSRDSDRSSRPDCVGQVALTAAVWRSPSVSR